MRLGRPGGTSTSRRILVFVLVIGLGAALVGGVYSYVLLTRPPTAEPCTTEAFVAGQSSPQPLVTFKIVTVDHGNATITIASARFCPPPSEYRFNIGFNGPGPVGGFASSGNYTTTVASNTSFRVYWMDEDRQGLVNVRDTFRVTGEGKPLPMGEQFTLYLYVTEVSLVAAANWRT